MKIGKLTKIAIVTICVMCMVLKPMCVYADEIETGEAELEIEDKEEAIPEAEVTPIVEVTPETRMLLMGAAPVNDEINIGDYPDGIVINSGNVSEYNGKTITGSAVQNANLVVDDVEVELTIKDLTIDRAQEGSHNYNCDAIYLKNGAKLILTLEGDNRLVGSNDNGGAGIRVEDDNTLIITENSSGTLEAVGGNAYGSAAGIGAGNCGYDGTHTSRSPVLGTIEIRGGTINASGGTSYQFLSEALGCAGIGCSAMCESGKGSITISGGNVTATGGYEGAGIGGGSVCSPNNITINGGVIIANAGQYAAAIGSGCNSSFETIQMGSISITGGKVTAKGNIGYGRSFFDGKFEGGSVEIKDNAIVTVTEGEINPKTDIEQGHVTQKYSLTITVRNPSYTTGTKAGHITIGFGENAVNKDIIYNLGGGEAVANIEIETILFGEQPVIASIDGTVLKEKTLVLGSETGLIYGNEAQDYSVSITDEVTLRYENGVLTISGNGSATVSMSDGVESTSDSIFIDDDADIVLTIKDITVDTTGKSRSPIAIGRNNQATCTIIPVGSNTLKRCDSRLAVGVIEASNGSMLTIGGYGTLNLQGKIGEGTNDKYKYAGGIRAIDAKVIIDDNPTLIISNPEGDAFSGILSKKITINGGNINSSVSNSSQGIGIPYDSNNKHDVIIKGGTVYAEGGGLANWLGAITNPICTRAVITGGSVNMNKLSRTDDNRIDNMKNNQPVNDKGEKLYCTTITVGMANDNGNYTLSKGVKVTELTVKDSDDMDYQYGIEGMYTDKDAKLYLWLPEGAVVSEVKTECGTYEGNCITNTDNTVEYKGNSFGTKKATFALAPGSDYTLILPGDGTEANPYKLSTREELEKFRDMVNSGSTEICGVLTTNINISERENWTPIGTEDNPYQGTFDGCGKKIDRLRISGSDSDYNNKGFFGVVDNAYIKNLTITGYVGINNYTVEAAENYGMFAGKASNSTFEGCINNGNVYGGQNAAGICGWASHCTFKKCTNDGGEPDGVIIGSYKTVCGIVYDADKSCTVENCVNSMHGNSQFCKRKDTAVMSDCYTIGGKNHINCLSLAAKYDNYDFVEEDADYYGHSRSDNENYAAYKAGGTKVTDNWRDGTIAYLLQGNQSELVWINIIDSNKSDSEKNYWPEINYTSDDACYRVYEVKTYTKCDKSDTPTLTYQNESGEDIVPTHSFTKKDKSSKAVKTPATCKDKAVYYYSCEYCGAVEKNNSHTFEGDVNPALHEPSDWKHDETYHWKECTVEGCGTVIAGTKAAHSSTGTNKATCQKAAVCDKCGMEYGETIPCSFTAKVKSEAALMTPASGTQEAVYYYSCSMCGAVGKDAEHTFVDHHEPEHNPVPDNEPSSDDESSADNESSSSNSPSLNDRSSVNNSLSLNDRSSVNNSPSLNNRPSVNNSLATNGNRVADSITELRDESETNTQDADLNDDNDTSVSDGDEEALISYDSSTETTEKVAETTGNNTDNSETIEEVDAVDKKEADRNKVVVVAATVAGSGTVSYGAYFLLKRKKMFEEIIKKLFRK